jgi:hypothetical protein
LEVCQCGKEAVEWVYRIRVNRFGVVEWKPTEQSERRIWPWLFNLLSKSIRDESEK